MPQEGLDVAVVQPTNAGVDHDHETPVSLPGDADVQLQELLAAYVNIGDQLASDSTVGIAEQAKRIGSAVDALVQVEVPGSPHFWHERDDDFSTIKDQAQALATPADLQAARIAYGVLSDALERIVASTGVPPSANQPAYRFVCGMFAEAPRGGVWLQFGDAPRNPYFGSRMLSCHREQAPIQKGGSAHHPAEQAGGEEGHEEHQHEHGGRG